MPTSDFYFTFALLVFLSSVVMVLGVVGWTRGTVYQARFKHRKIKTKDQVSYRCPCCSANLTLGIKNLQKSGASSNYLGTEVTFSCSSCAALQKWDIGGAKFAPVWWRKPVIATKTSSQ